MKTIHTRSAAALCSLVALLALSISLPVKAEPYKLRAVQEDKLHNPNTTLNRGDVKPGKADPFSNDDDDETLDAPQQMFQPQRPMMAPPQKPLQGGALQNDAGNFGGMPDRVPIARPNMSGQPDSVPQKPPFDPNDPDSSPDMQLAWDQWHRRVAATIFDRFNFFAKAAFKHSAPLLSSLSYQVTRDGHIINMNMGQKSPNVLFNVLVYQSVKSLEGDMSVLAFPQGSRRMTVAKLGTFTQNYGQEGFKYQTGDQERVRAAQAR